MSDIHWEAQFGLMVIVRIRSDGPQSKEELRVYFTQNNFSFTEEGLHGALDWAVSHGHIHLEDDGKYHKGCTKSIDIVALNQKVDSLEADLKELRSLLEEQNHILEDLVRKMKKE